MVGAAVAEHDGSSVAHRIGVWGPDPELTEDGRPDPDVLDHDGAPAELMAAGGASRPAIHRDQPPMLLRRPPEGEVRRLVPYAVRVGWLAARRSRAEPESDVARQARVRSLAEQPLGVGVKVIGRDPAQAAEVAADQAGVEVDDPGVFHDGQQRRLRPGEGERRPAELPQQLDVLLARAPDRAD